MPGSLDFTGMLASLQGRRPPAPRDALTDLESAAATAATRMAAFTALVPAPPEPVVPPQRRPGP